MKTAELLTYHDIESLPREGRYEIIDGRLIEMSPAGGWHSRAVARISARLVRLLEERGMGYVFAGELGLVIKREPLTLRASDIAFYSRERLREVPRGFLQEPPDLVVEVIAEETSMEYFEEKLKDYLNFGVGRLVFVDLIKKLVLVVDEERKIALYGFEEEVELYKGVRLKFSEIMEVV